MAAEYLSEAAGRHAAHAQEERQCMRSRRSNMDTSVTSLEKPCRTKVIKMEAPEKVHRHKVVGTGPASSICYNDIHRCTSSLWEDESVPFQLYEVQKRPPHVIDVYVMRGRGITKGWFQDLLDVPDPYLMIRIPGTPNGVKRTKTVDNTKDPIWNEHVYFIVDSHTTAKIEFKLMDSNYIKDRHMGTVLIPLDRIYVNEVDTREITFQNNSRVFVKISRRESTTAADLRLEQSLSKEERQFLQRRRRHVLAALQRLLGNSDGDARGCSSPSEVPIVAVLGSGGGFRAMSGMSGALKALHETGLLDCATYVAGVSGSAWYFGYLYSQPGHFKQGPGAYEDALRNRVCRGWQNRLLPHNLFRYLHTIGNKASNGQPVAFADLFGYFVSETLLGEKLAEQPLSSQRADLEEGEAPLPVYTAVHVNRDVSAQVFQEWLEFTPYDVTLGKYGVSMKTEVFGDKMFCGHAMHRFPEFPMSFLMGVWGSAFSILFKRLVWDHRKQNIYFEDSTAETEKEANADLAMFRAAREGYPDFNNDTGSSNDSLVARSDDEESSEEEEELHEQQEQRRAEREAEERRAEQQRHESHLSHLSELSRILREDSLSPPKPMDNMSFRKSTYYHWRDSAKSVLSTVSATESIKKKKKFREVIKAYRNKKGNTQRTFWRRMMDMLLSEGMWDTRMGRAGLIFNPLRGLVLKPLFARGLEQTVTPKDTEPLKGSYTQSEPRSKRWFVVDAGLAQNLPFPPLLRPQRAVDLFIVFDFSSRPADDSSPFDHILLAERWARIHNVRFPPITNQVERFLKAKPRDFYIFQDKEDPVCPVVLYFPLININFRTFKAPGVPRTTTYERQFGDFSIFSDPNNTYSMTNFRYEALAFDRLVRLVEFNVLENVAGITAALQAAVRRKRQLMSKEPDDQREREEETAVHDVRRRERRRHPRPEKTKERKEQELAEQIRKAQLDPGAAATHVRRRHKSSLLAPGRLRTHGPGATHELAQALGEAARTARDTDPKAPITQLLQIAYRSACKSVKERHGGSRSESRRSAGKWDVAHRSLAPITSSTSMDSNTPVQSVVSMFSRVVNATVPSKLMPVRSKAH